MLKNYHLDTNVLLENPNSIEILRNGAENKISISTTVINELDHLLKTPQKRPMALKALEKIWELKEYITFTGDINSIKNNDDEILSTLDGQQEPVLVTNDNLLRLKSYIKGYQSETFKDSLPFHSDSQLYTGMLDESEENKPENSFFIKEGKLFQWFKGKERCVSYEVNPWKLKPWDIYQQAAIELLNNDNILVSSLQSRAGAGKSILSLASGMEQVFKKKKYSKLVIMKYPIEIGEEMGFLPGPVEEKMFPHWNSLYRILIKLHESYPCNKLWLDPSAPLPEINPRKCEFYPINFLRGVNIEDSYIVITESQNIPRHIMKTILTRMGENTKVVIEGDTSQVDNPRCNNINNGLNWVVKLFKGHRNYGHIVLNGKKTRGEICNMTLESGL